ncbi:Mss4-like protein [Collybia nuda]|uniref:Mss4-like protein n=1 Tax=Collybia nuda TaxID=64659 RepID=A0A9P5Y3Q5_9AGAR|nr:Mss4-like protein [Collybia nuda]
MAIKGACLCGQVTITLESEHNDQVACHCNDCKQTSGSAFSTNVLAPQKDVKIEGSFKVYDSKGASGNTVSRIFCSNCGSAISHKSVAFGEAQAIQTGNFTHFSKIPFAAELFVKDRWEGLGPIPGAAGQFQIMPDH